jgi:hypothetical protein
MIEISREVIQELMHLNAYRKTESPMQVAHEALFRAKVIEYAEGLIQAAAEREELAGKLAKAELCLKEAIETMNDFKNAVAAA